jgi:N6-adenosine-specific RNA methylase IME4
MLSDGPLPDAFPPRVRLDLKGVRVGIGHWLSHSEAIILAFSIGHLRGLNSAAEAQLIAVM